MSGLGTFFKVGGVGGAGILGLIFILLIIICGPIITIWSLNALFPLLAIPLTVKTWFATAIALMTLRGCCSTTVKTS
jgi:hypothetical protein